MSGAWTLAPHACKACGGRILQDQDRFFCPTCGAEAHGTPTPICGCGIRIAGMPASRSTTSRFTCAPNPAPSQADPAQVVILFDGAPTRAPV